MTEEELREKRNRMIESLNDIKAMFGLDELYIDELEKELADAKKVQVVEHFEAYGQCRDSRRITELEQENAELKEAIKHFNPCGEWDDDVHDCEFRHYAMEYGSQLTKAKELLKTCLSKAIGNIDPSWSELIADIEQFLAD